MATKSSKAYAEPSMDDWRVEEDLRTLCRAEEIEKDPKRMAAVTALAKKKMLKMASIASEGSGDKD